MGTKSGSKPELGFPTYYSEFSLSISEAMKTQLMTAMVRLIPVPLTLENLSVLERRAGIYQLFLDGKSVYVGKADDNLYSRIDQHRRKLLSRREEKVEGRDPNPLLLSERMSFRCMYVNEDMDSLGPEKMLIKQFISTGEALWNNKGFGNNDPGKERDTSLVKESHFDKAYPINLDLPVTPVAKVSAKSSVSEPINNLHTAMTAIKLALPFNFRFSNTVPHAGELMAIPVDETQVNGVTLTAQEWFSWIANRLPDGWVIIALPAYVIAYPKTKFEVEKYLSRMSVWWSEGGTHSFEEHKVDWAPGEVKVED